MKEELRNYSTQPDPEVWNKISKTLRRQNFRRQAIGGSIGLLIAVLAIVGVVSWPYDSLSVAPVPASPQMAQAVDVTEPEGSEVVALAEEAAQVQKEQLPAVVPTANSLSEEKAEPAAAATPVAIETPAPTVPVQPKQTTPIESSANVVVPSVPLVVPTAVQEEPQPIVAENDEVEKVKSTPATKIVTPNGVIEDTILWVPNAFAPASDDPQITTFRARLNKPEMSLTNYRITIFNRTGHQVFHSTDINQAWDGTYKGRPLPQAGYVYVIYYVDKDGLTHQRKGSVALIR